MGGLALDVPLDHQQDPGACVALHAGPVDAAVPAPKSLGRLARPVDGGAEEGSGADPAIRAAVPPLGAEGSAAHAESDVQADLGLEGLVGRPGAGGPAPEPKWVTRNGTR